MQKLSYKGIEIILDVAHNPHAARYLVDKLIKMPPVTATHAIFAVQATKDLAGIVAECAGVIDSWQIVAIDAAPKALTPLELQQKMQELLPAAKLNLCNNIVSYLNSLQHRDNCRVVVFGSFYTVALVLQVLDRA
jgi:dihydrofolate synthase/folylpolyglutamate synthase